MAGREMRMPKHHAERLPTSKLLHGPEINASTSKPAREAVVLIADGVQISAGKCSECLQEKTVVRALAASSKICPRRMERLTSSSRAARVHGVDVVRRLYRRMGTRSIVTR